MANKFFSLFEGWFSNSKNAEQHFFRNRNEFFGRKGAAYLDVDVPYRLYNEIPELNQVINKKADMFSNGEFKVYNSAGKEVDHPMLKLLNEPNAFQSQNEWMRNYAIQLMVYGNQMMYKNKVSVLEKLPKSLINISPRYVIINLTGKMFDQTDLKGMIKDFEYRAGNVLRIFTYDDIIWTRNSDLDDPLVGTSPLKSLRFPLTNTKLAYDYLNIISGEKGAVGLLSNTSKDGFGALPMTPEQKIEIANEFTGTYGVGDDKKSRIAIVSGNTTWTPMSYPTKELLLLEQIDANKLTICDHFGLNINIFSSKTATFENVKNGIIQSYNDAVFPFADQFTQKIQKELGVDEKQYKLTLDYSHISVLQADKEKEAKTLQMQLDSVANAVQNQILTPQQATNIYRNTFSIELDK